MPVAVIEAMASGLPVLATPGCNLPEIEAAGAGLIVEPEPEAVARALPEILERKDRGERGRSLVRERFTWKVIARRTIEVYGEMQAA